MVTCLKLSKQATNPRRHDKLPGTIKIPGFLNWIGSIFVKTSILVLAVLQKADLASVFERGIH